MKALTILFIIAVLNINVSAAGRTGNWLMPVLVSIIKASENPNHRVGNNELYVLGMISGISHAASLNSKTAQQRKEVFGFTIPQKATRGQLARVIHRFLVKNPNWLNRPAEVCICFALYDTYGKKHK